MWGFFNLVLGILNRRDQVRERRSKEDAARPFAELQHRLLPGDGRWVLISDGTLFGFTISVYNPGRTPFRIESFEVKKPKGAVLYFPRELQAGDAWPVSGHAGVGRIVPVVWEVGPPTTEHSTFAASTRFSVKLPEKRRLPWIRRKSETLIRVVLKGRHKSAAASPVRIRGEVMVEVPAELLG